MNHVISDLETTLQANGKPLEGLEQKDNTT